MKLRVDRQEFTEAIAWATRVAGSRAALPALTGVLLEAVLLMSEVMQILLQWVTV